MEQTITRKICDACGYVEERDNSAFCNSPFKGWTKIFHAGKPMQNRHVDVCCKECAKKLLDSIYEKENDKEDYVFPHTISEKEWEEKCGF